MNGDVFDVFRIFHHPLPWSIYISAEEKGCRDWVKETWEKGGLILLLLSLRRVFISNGVTGGLFIWVWRYIRRLLLWQGVTLHSLTEQKHWLLLSFSSPGHITAGLETSRRCTHMVCMYCTFRSGLGANRWIRLKRPLLLQSMCLKEAPACYILPQRSN